MTEQTIAEAARLVMPCDFTESEREDVLPKLVRPEWKPALYDEAEWRARHEAEQREEDARFSRAVGAVMDVEFRRAAHPDAVHIQKPVHGCGRVASGRDRSPPTVLRVPSRDNARAGMARAIHRVWHRGLHLRPEPGSSERVRGRAALFYRQYPEGGACRRQQMT